MNRAICLSGLMSLVMAVNLQAGFEWTASNWTISALSEVNSPGPPAAATVTSGPTNGDLITANIFASASNVLPGTATAILTFSRSYTIFEDFPGQPVEVHFRRTAIGSVTGSGLGGTLRQAMM